MTYDIQFNLPDGWIKELETYNDSGFDINHLEARHPDSDGKRDDIMVDVYVGEMPEGETAEDQAFANYAEVVGFDDDDESPIECFKLNGRKAWGFEAVTEDEYPMRFISQEVRKGILAIIVYAVAEESLLQSTFDIIERNLRIK